MTTSASVHWSLCEAHARHASLSYTAKPFDRRRPPAQGDTRLRLPRPFPFPVRTTSRHPLLRPPPPAPFPIDIYPGLVSYGSPLPFPSGAPRQIPRRSQGTPVKQRQECTSHGALSAQQQYLANESFTALLCAAVALENSRDCPLP